jgi:small-conductance mechanosensitive channel
MLSFVQVGATDTTRLIILETLKAYILCRALLALAKALVSPRKPRLRLLSVGDQTAAYIEAWARRLVVFVVVGATIAEVAELLGGSTHLRHGLVKIVGLVVNLCLITIVLQCRAAVANRLRVPSDAVGALAALRNRLADVWHFAAIAAIITLWFVWAVRAQDSPSRALQLVVESALALALARVVAITALGALDRLTRINQDLAARFPGLETRANRYYPALRAAISLTIVWITAIALFEIWGVDAISWFTRGAFGSLLVSALATIAIAATLAAAVWEAANAAIDRHLERLNREARLQQAARLRTLSPILRTTLLIAILIVLGLTALSEIGVNIAPLLAGAGIVGIAIGFGSQKLVQDLITGLFLLLENAIQVGDWVTAAGLSGSVETLSIRTMRLRAGDGSVHIVPFSSVTSVTNANRGIGNAAVSVSVAYDEDTDRVGQTLTEIAVEMRQEAKFKPSMLSELQLWGVDKVDSLGATIVGQIVCTDAGRWEVQREFNRRMKQRFQQLGIQIAPPAPTVMIAPQILRPGALNADERAPNDLDEARDRARRDG